MLMCCNTSTIRSSVTTSSRSSSTAVGRSNQNRDRLRICRCPATPAAARQHGQPCPLVFSAGASLPRAQPSRQLIKPEGNNDMNSTNDNPIQTTDSGIPVESDQYSLTVGADGPILLQDSYLIEQMANFNRERIAERQPHAKGSGAFGYFEVTKDLSAYTKAAVFQPGTKT